jgi:hypothetical protein
MRQGIRRMDETTIQLSNNAVGAFQVFGAARAPVSHAGVFNGLAPRWNSEAREFARLMIQRRARRGASECVFFGGAHQYPLAIAMAHLLRRMNLHSVLAWRTTTSCPCLSWSPRCVSTLVDTLISAVAQADQS